MPNLPKRWDTSPAAQRLTRTALSSDKARSARRASAVRISSCRLRSASTSCRSRSASRSWRVSSAEPTGIVANEFRCASSSSSRVATSPSIRGTCCRAWMARLIFTQPAYGLWPPHGTLSSSSDSARERFKSRRFIFISASIARSAVFTSELDASSCCVSSICRWSWVSTAMCRAHEARVPSALPAASIAWCK
jgi:hypothetical protein